MFPGDGCGERLCGRGLRVDVHLVDEEEGEAAVAGDPLAEELVHPLQDEGPGRVLKVVGAGNATDALNESKLRIVARSCNLSATRVVPLTVESLVGMHSGVDGSSSLTFFFSPA